MRKYVLQLEADDETAPLSPENLAKELRLPDGWRLAAHDALEEPRAVGDVFTYALLLWPAVVGLLVLGSEGWQLALRIALAVWLGLLHLVAYRGAGGRFFGTSMLMLSGCVAAFWWTHPGPWMLLWLCFLWVGLYAAVRGAWTDGARAPALATAPAGAHK